MIKARLPRAAAVLVCLVLTTSCSERAVELVCNAPPALEFGSIPLYAKLASRPIGAQVRPRCDVTIECSFTTAEGIVYVAFEDELMEKRLFVPNTRGTARLPFGFEEGDTVAEVLAKLKVRGIHAERFERDGEVFALAAGCRGDPADQLSVHFDARGRVSQVELSMFPI